MPNAADIPLEETTSYLLIGDGGTHKTWFIGTMPQPSFTYDFDNGMAVHRGRADMDYAMFKELARGEKLHDWMKKAGGWYEWGTAWPAIVAQTNKIGKAMDNGTNQYKTLGFDSLTTMCDLCLNYIKRGNVKPDNPTGEFKDGRQMWGAFLNNMTEMFSQLTAWPVNKVLTAHIKRDENLILETIEKLPAVSGQFAAKVPIYFDEVYYTEVEVTGGTGGTAKTERFFFRCHQDGSIKQAKSRKLNLPDKLPTDYREIMKYLASKPAG